MGESNKMVKLQDVVQAKQVPFKKKYKENQKILLQLKWSQ